MTTPIFSMDPPRGVKFPRWLIPMVLLLALSIFALSQVEWHSLRVLATSAEEISQEIGELEGKLGQDGDAVEKAQQSAEAFGKIVEKTAEALTKGEISQEEARAIYERLGALIPDLNGTMESGQRANNGRDLDGQMAEWARIAQRIGDLVIENAGPEGDEETRQRLVDFMGLLGVVSGMTADRVDSRIYTGEGMDPETGSLTARAHQRAIQSAIETARRIAENPIWPLGPGVP